MTHRRLLLVAVLTGCAAEGSDTVDLPAPLDAAPDKTAPDAADDAPADSATTIDAAPDAPVDATIDAPRDAAPLVDAPAADARADATPDAARDADAPADASGEVCGNGRDDDRDGRIDENCSCAAGATQFCYPGSLDEAGRGACRTGLQRCAGTGELATWGDCAGAVTPAADVCGDAMDQDCNGVVDDGAACCRAGATEDCYTGLPATRAVGPCRAGSRSCASGTYGACVGEVLPTAEVCGNGVDDNCDGAVDEGCMGCASQAVRWNIPPGTVGGPACITTGGGYCEGTAYCSGASCSTRPPSGCGGEAHCGTLRCNDGSYTRANYCTVIAACTGSGVSATGYTW